MQLWGGETNWTKTSLQAGDELRWEAADCTITAKRGGQVLYWDNGTEKLPPFCMSAPSFIVFVTALANGLGLTPRVWSNAQRVTCTFV